MSVLPEYINLISDNEEKQTRITKFISEFKNYIIENNINNIFIVSHLLVDVDGFSSIFALKSLLKAMFRDNQDIKIYSVMSGRNNQADKLIESYGLKEGTDFIKKLSSTPDLLILVDCNHLSLVDPEIIKDCEPKHIVIIDHHQSTVEYTKNYNLWYIDPQSSSNAEILVDLFSVTQIPLSKEIGFLLLVGILTDTGQFKYANPDTYIRVSQLEKTGSSVKEASALLQSKNYEMPERIARIKAAMRISELLVHDNYIILISNVSSYQAAAARALVELGADLSFIIAKEKPKKNLSFGISTRSTATFNKECDFNSGLFLSSFFQQFDGMGGGHAGAAAGKGKIDEEKLMIFLEENTKNTKNEGKIRYSEEDIIQYIKYELYKAINLIREWRVVY